MNIQKCENCETPFKWKVILLSIWLAYKPIFCKNCSAKHEITFTSRFIVMIIVLFPMFLFSFIFPNQMSIGLTISTMIGLAFVFSLFLPFIVQYSEKK